MAAPSGPLQNTNTTSTINTSFPQYRNNHSFIFIPFTFFSRGEWERGGHWGRREGKGEGGGGWGREGPIPAHLHNVGLRQLIYLSIDFL
jgi:hypothetical protein